MQPTHPTQTHPTQTQGYHVARLAADLHDFLTQLDLTVRGAGG